MYLLGPYFSKGYPQNFLAKEQNGKLMTDKKKGNNLHKLSVK